jgi:hypothetical protein
MTGGYRIRVPVRQQTAKFLEIFFLIDAKEEDTSV